MTACGPPTATSVTGGTAPNTAGQLPRIPPSGCCPSAVELYSSRGDNNHLDWSRIEQSSTVPTNGNTCLTFWFAGVFESHHYDIGEIANQSDSYLQINVIVGGATVASLTYSWENNLNQLVQLPNSAVSAVGDGTYCNVNGDPNRWGYLPWSPYSINLCQYAGQRVTFQATDYDCDAGGHYGFGYVSCLNWGSCAPAPVTLTKSNNPTGQVSAGQTITYTLNYQNRSNTDYTDGVVVFDTVPTGTGFVSGSQASNPPMPVTFQTGNVVGWNIGYLKPGASGSLSFAVTVNDLSTGSCSAAVTNQAAEKDLTTCYLIPTLVTSNAVTNFLGFTCTPTATVTNTRTPSPTMTRTPTQTTTSTSTTSATSTTTSTTTRTPTSTTTSTTTETPTLTQTATASSTATQTASKTASSTATSSATSTTTASATTTATKTAMSTATSSTTATATRSATATTTASATATAVSTSTSTATLTATRTATHTTTATASFTTTSTATTTATATATSTFSATTTATRTATATATATATSTFTATSTATSTATATPSFTATATTTATATFTATNTATSTATATATSTATDTATPTATFTPTWSPTPTPTLQITLAKQVSPNITQSGNVLNYTLTLAITGITASGITVTDTLPAQMTYVGPSSNNPPSLPAPVYNSGLNQLVWTLPPLSPGTYQLSYQGRVNDLVPGGTTLTNVAVMARAGSQPVTASAQALVIAALTLDLGVYNEAGELVQTITTEPISEAIPGITLSTGTITELTGPGGAVTVYFDGIVLGVWNGLSATGTPVSNGTYVIKADNVDRAGTVTTISQQVTVSRPVARLSANVYNEAGEVVRHLYAVVAGGQNSSMTDVKLSSDVIRPGITAPNSTSNAQIIIQTSTAGITLSWDGTNDSGAIVTDGSYEIGVHWDNGTGITQDLTKEITVTGGGHLNQVIAAPNVLTSAHSVALFGVQSTSPYTLKVRIYTVAGELVGVVQGGEGTNQASWDSAGKASGLYFAVVELNNPQGGMVGHQILKLSVMR